MRKSVLALALIVATLSCGSLAFAQEAPSNEATEPSKAAKAVSEEARFYTLNFVVQELNQDGKPINSRSYTVTASTMLGHPILIRNDSRIPVPIGASGTNMPSQWQYVNADVNFDVHEVHEIGKQLAFQVRADVTSIAPISNNADSRQDHITRHNQWDSMVLIPIGKATSIFVSDSLDSKGSMQVVVTATPLQ